jgi:hypothetical protein
LPSALSSAIVVVVTDPPKSPELLAERKRFNTDVAINLHPAEFAWQPTKGFLSSRFSWYETDEDYLIVVGVQEEQDADLALAYGLKRRGKKHLHLVLPRSFSVATIQRSAFLKAETQPTVYVHDVAWGAVTPTELKRLKGRSQTEAVAAVVKRIPKRRTPAEDLADAANPKHLGDRSEAVADLVEWATRHKFLDPGHRRGERSWHCMGQKVLSIKGLKGKGLAIRSGIHYSDREKAPTPLTLTSKQTLTNDELHEIKTSVEAAVAARMNKGGKFHKADEHWLQAVIRLHPELVGVEQPALRELPAWRPGGDEESWGRGYVDLAGLDGSGDIRIVETKLAKNTDDMLIFQGLDYYIWAQAYDEAIRGRLGAAKRAPFVVHYVIGENPANQSTHVSSYAAAQAAALEIHWRFQVIRDWFSSDPDSVGVATAELLDKGRLP